MEAVIITISYFAHIHIVFSMNIRFRQLQGFVAAARHASFINAARELAMTQPAFSHLIRDLESTLGIRLFSRTTRRVELTEAGLRFLTMVQHPLDDLAAAYRHAGEMASGQRGRIAFASLNSVAFGLVTKTLAQFKLRHPAISVRLVESNNRDLVDRVLHREVDFAVGARPAPHRELDFRKLLQDELLAVYPAGHALAARRRITWRDIGAEPLVLMPKGSSTREFVERGFAVSHVAREADYEVVNMVTSLSMVRAGLAITIMSRTALSELNTAGLSVSRIGDPHPVRDIGIIVRHDRMLSTAARTYVDLLFAAAASDGQNARPEKRRR